MKKKLLLFAVVASAFLNAYAGGILNPVTPTPIDQLTDTTIGDKSFIKIYNASDLYGFKNAVSDKSNGSLNAILMDNIMVNEDVWKSSDEGNIILSENLIPWETVTESYNGVFDGNNCFIFGLYGAPLFAEIGEKGEVKDVVIKGSYFDRHKIYEIDSAEKRYVGSVCYTNYGTISGCVSAENFITADNFVGGIAGDNRGLILKCFDDYSVISYTSIAPAAGNICGYNVGKIQNCESFNDNNLNLTFNGNGGINEDDGSTFFVQIIDVMEQNYIYKVVDGNDLSKMKFDQDLIGIVYAIENSISMDSIKKLMKPFTFMVDEEQCLYYTPKFVVDDSKFLNNEFYQSMFGGFLVDTFVYNRVPTSDIVTFCLPVDIPTEKVNGDVYVFDGYKGSTLHFSKVEDAVLTSSTPYVVKNVDKSKNLIDEIYQDTFLYNLENNVLMRDNMIHFGNLYNADTISDGNMYVYNNGEFCQFDKMLLRPFRTFFQFIEEPSPSSRPHAFSVSFDDNTTGVMMIENNQVVSGVVTVYDALGRVVRANVESATCFEGLSAGVYVVNGQKFIVKE
ncbi:MAG: hypothetical protein MJZ34_14310 [Paludibacteraceae bacterium]|nr:hypothetical protein [Paludibacteraceae bacterium]